MVLESVVQYLSELGQNILTAARNFTFKDAIDVAIVTVLLYSAIKLVRETRAGQLVKGIILLIVHRGHFVPAGNPQGLGAGGPQQGGAVPGKHRFCQR